MPMVKGFAKQARGIILTFDVSDRKSLEVCDYWVRELSKEGEPKRAAVAVGNKIDLVDQRKISTEEAQAHFESMYPSIPYFEASALTGEGVEEPFMKVSMMVLKEIWTFVPQSNENADVPVEAEERSPETDGKCVIC